MVDIFLILVKKVLSVRGGLRQKKSDFSFVFEKKCPLQARMTKTPSRTDLFGGEAFLQNRGAGLFLQILLVFLVLSKDVQKFRKVMEL